MKKCYSLKQKIGVLILDWPKFKKKLRGSPSVSPYPEWIEICNRNESLERAPRGPGVLCKWKWTSDLHAAKVFPSLGLRLMKRVIKDWPIELLNYPKKDANDIGISFIIGHRGKERLPHLLTTLQTIAAQKNISLECIVVEQSSLREIESLLPSWVRYIHTPLPRPDMPYCRSWAFNVGARQALGRVLIFHDNDLLLPTRYAEEVMKRHEEGYDVINLKRFIFYLNGTHTERVITLSCFSCHAAPLSIMQNAEAGGSLAVGKNAFFAIGGFDESFVGWGGEDNEFWERAQSLKVWPFGYLPLIHLWHDAHPEKVCQGSDNKKLYQERSAISVTDRIKELADRNCRAKFPLRRGE